MARRRAWLALVTALLAGACPGHEAIPRQDFVAPPAGSYGLPVIGHAPDGPVLDSDGRGARLARYTRGKVTLLAFIYTYCVDPLGCPLSHRSFVELRQRLLARPELAAGVRLVSLSLDPVHDTPAAMRAYGEAYASAAGLDWRFLTTRSRAALAPLLAGFGQDVSIERASGAVSGHLTRVFLLDRRGRIREIYSPAFLLPTVILNDIETLLGEAPAPTGAGR